MSKDVKGVFVRLPLSEEQINELYHTVMYCGEEAALLAIGTPVADGELETEVVRVREHRKDIELPWTYHKAPPSDQDASEYELEVDRLLTHKQAFARLTEKDAEIARLRLALARICDSGTQRTTVSMRKIARAALKGPEA